MVCHAPFTPSWRGIGDAYGDRRSDCDIFMDFFSFSVEPLFKGHDTFALLYRS